MRLPRIYYDNIVVAFFLKNKIPTYLKHIDIRYLVSRDWFQIIKCHQAHSCNAHSCRLHDQSIDPNTYKGHVLEMGLTEIF